MRVWIGRPAREAQRTSAAVAALGHAPLVAPVVAVEALSTPAPAGPFAAVLLTSANAVAALDEEARAALRRLADGRPVLSVGPRTAAAAREAGLATATEAGGDAAALAGATLAALPGGGRVLHVAGRPRKREPGATLARRGIVVDCWETYATRPVPSLPAAAAEALGAGTLDAALHYSRRSAAAALRLSEEAGLRAPFLALAHHCLSRDVAAPLVAAGAAWHVVAKRPDEAALLAGLPPRERTA